MAIAAPLLIASAVISAGSAVAGGIAQGQAASYQSEVAANNAKIAHQNAEYTAKAGAVQTESAGLKAASRDANVKAAIAANNLDVTTGSPVDVETSEHRAGLLDTATVANNAALQTYGYESQATGYTAQSGLDSGEAGYDVGAGLLKGAGSLLSAAPDIGSKFGWMDQGGNGATTDDLFSSTRGTADPGGDIG